MWVFPFMLITSIATFWAKAFTPMYMAQLDTVSQNNSALYERTDIKQRFFKSLLMTASIIGQKN